LDNLLHRTSVSVGLDEISRLIGYPSPEHISAPVRDTCLAEIARLPALCEPWGTWRDFELRSTHADRIELAGGLRLSSRRLARLMRRARTLRLFVATLGDGVSHEIRRLVHDDCMPEAMALDAAATVAIHSLSEDLIRRTCDEVQKIGLGTTTRYAPGYTGWDIRDITALFETLGQEMPVRLNAQLMMRPEKSLLSIVGLTDDGRVAAPLEQCQGCDLLRCSAREAPYRAPRAT